MQSSPERAKPMVWGLSICCYNFLLLHWLYCMTTVQLLWINTLYACCREYIRFIIIIISWPCKLRLVPCWSLSKLIAFNERTHVEHNARVSCINGIIFHELYILSFLFHLKKKRWFGATHFQHQPYWSVWRRPFLSAFIFVVHVFMFLFRSCRWTVKRFLMKDERWRTLSQTYPAWKSFRAIKYFTSKWCHFSCSP